MVSVQVKKASSDTSRGVSLTRGSSVKLADSAIFPGIVHDGANIVVSYAKQNDLYAVNCDNNLNQTSTPRRITSTGNVTDHKHIFFQNYHYLLYSIIGDADMYLIKLDMNLAQVGDKVQVTTASSETKTNDMLLGTDGTDLITGEFLMPVPSLSINSGHLLKTFDQNLNRIHPDLWVNGVAHTNTASVLRIGSDMCIVAPILASNRQVETQMDLGLLKIYSNSAIKLVDSNTLNHSANGDGIWMSTGLAYDSQTDKMIVGYTFRYAASGSDTGKIYLKIFDATSYEEKYSEIMVDSNRANRAHFLLTEDAFYAVYDDSSSGSPAIHGIKYAVTRY